MDDQEGRTPSGRLDIQTFENQRSFSLMWNPDDWISYEHRTIQLSGLWHKYDVIGIQDGRSTSEKHAKYDLETIVRQSCRAHMIYGPNLNVILLDFLYNLSSWP